MNVFADLSGIDLDWIGLQSFIQVERRGIRSGKPNPPNQLLHQLAMQPRRLNLRREFVSTGELRIVCVIVKDVILGEDAAPFKDYNAATNWSLIRTIAINIARMCGYDSLTKAERFLAHDIDKLFSLVE